MKHGRLRWYEPEELDPAQQRVYQAITAGPRAQGRQIFSLVDPHGRLEGPFNAMLLSPHVGLVLQELGSAIRYHTSLSSRLREIAILEVARLRRSEFEWYAHAAIGASVGLTADEITALREGRAHPDLSSAERLARDVIGWLLTARTVPEDLLAETRALIGTEQVMELLVLAGYYDTLALSLEVWRTPLPHGVAPPFADGAKPTSEGAE